MPKTRLLACQVGKIPLSLTVGRYGNWKGSFAALLGWLRTVVAVCWGTSNVDLKGVLLQRSKSLLGINVKLAEENYLREIRENDQNVVWNESLDVLGNCPDLGACHDRAGWRTFLSEIFGNVRFLLLFANFYWNIWHRTLTAGVPVKEGLLARHSSNGICWEAI